MVQMVGAGRGVSAMSRTCTASIPVIRSLAPEHRNWRLLQSTPDGTRRRTINLKAPGISHQIALKPGRTDLMA